VTMSQLEAKGDGGNSAAYLAARLKKAGRARHEEGPRSCDRGPTTERRNPDGPQRVQSMG
jgi:hypothetical protein